MVSAGSSTYSEVESRDVWAAVRQYSLYELADTELDALIARYRRSPLMADRIIVEASQHVCDLRQSLAAGKAC